jgi:hypothetical protein
VQARAANDRSTRRRRKQLPSYPKVYEPLENYQNTGRGSYQLHAQQIVAAGRETRSAPAAFQRRLRQDQRGGDYIHPPPQYFKIAGRHAITSIERLGHGASLACKQLAFRAGAFDFPRYQRQGHAKKALFALRRGQGGGININPLDEGGGDTRPVLRTPMSETAQIWFNAAASWGGFNPFLSMAQI